MAHQLPPTLSSSQPLYECITAHRAPGLLCWRGWGGKVWESVQLPALTQPLTWKRIGLHAQECTSASWGPGPGDGGQGLRELLAGSC